MSGVLMEVDDDSVLRWELRDFLERWRHTNDDDLLTSGLFGLKTEDGKETRFYLLLDLDEVHLRCLDDASEWKNLLIGQPLWIEREDGTKGAEEKIKKHWLRGLHCDSCTLAEFEEGETLTICVRPTPPAAVFPFQLQPLLSLSQHHVGELPDHEFYGRAFNWKTEVNVEKLGKFIIELDKEAEEEEWWEGAMCNWVAAKLILPQLPPNTQEVVLKYDLWIVEVDSDGQDWDAEPGERQPRTPIKGNIASFTDDRTEATVMFHGAIGERWDGRLDLLVHGYRVVPKLPPPPRMDERGMLNTLFGEKFNDPNYANISVLVGDQVFHVSKEILAMHSTYFHAMFKHKWKERESNAISIKDFVPEIVEAMLRFMYTGRVENLEENARQLFLAADKYDVKLLRDLTVDHLCAKVALENVVEMLEFALEHPALEKLREWALDFAARHYPQLHDREEWKKFAVEDPPLVLRLMEKVVVHE